MSDKEKAWNLNDPGRDLKAKADAKTAWHEKLPADLSKMSHEDLIRELKAYHIELEAQNEELKYDRAQIEESRNRLARSEEYYKSLTENSSDIILVTDAKGIIKYASLSLERWLGYRAEEVTGKSAVDFIHRDDLSRATAVFARAILQKDMAIPGAFRVIHKDGSVRTFEGLGRGLFDNPVIAGFVMNIHDATERNRVQDELAASEEKFRVLFESAPDAYYLCDLAGTFLDGNRSAEILTGYSKEELAGKNFLKIGILPPHEVPKAVSRLAESLIGRPTGPDDFTLMRKDGSIVRAEISTQPVKLKGKTVVLGIARDVTRRKAADDELVQAYAQLKETQAELIQSEKMSAIGRLASGIAHEVKNPLGIILGGTEFLEAKFLHGDEDAKSAIETIKDAVLRANAILGTILQYARPAELKTERVRLNDLIKDVSALFRLQPSIARVAVEVEPCKEDMFVNVDKNQIHQVIFNVVKNGIESMPGSGKVAIRTRHDQDTGVVEVVDSGGGMPEEVLAKLFEPFYTTKGPDKGSGLGLFVAKTIIANHGGQLSIDSEVGKGTTVRIALPLAKKETNA